MIVNDPSFGEKEMNEEQGTWCYAVCGAQQIDVVRYRSTPGRLEHLRRCVYDGERLVRQHMLMRRNGSETNYVWDDDRLIRTVMILVQNCS